MSKRAKLQKGKAAGVSKGAPSGVMVSILLHAGAFALAGLLVVFSVVNKPEITFDPPRATERPKMKLKKPKVQVKKSARPHNTSHIVTKVDKAQMPDIQLPEMSGIGDGLVGGIGGFDLSEGIGGGATLFGDTFSTGNDLKGEFIDFKRGRSGRPVPMSPDQMEALIHKYMKSGWKNSVIAQYYRSPRKLYSSTVCIPTTLSEVAPWSFGETNTLGYCWAVLYEGKLVYPEDITFRFWGVGDKFHGVNVDGETVLFCAYRARTREYFSNIWDTKDPKDHTYFFAEARARPSDWITLKANEPKDIKIMFGDLDGGLNYHILTVEVEGQEYPWTRAGGGPTFPVFRVSEIPRDVQDKICLNLYPGDACLTNGPIFRDFVSKVEQPKPLEEPPPPELKSMDLGTRAWTTGDGKTLEAEYKTMMGAHTVIFEKGRGQQVKFPFEELSEADQELLQLINPPDFDINFMKKSDQVANPQPSPYTGPRPMQISDYTFGVGVKQMSAFRGYDHELTVDYFALGEEVEGNNWIYLEHKSDTFNPAEYRGKVFEFRGNKVRMTKIAFRDTNPVRGTKYGGYVVTITDKEGDIISYKASHEFLFEKLNKLKRMPVGSYFNRSVDRVYPTQPTEDNRGYGAIDGSG